MFLLTSLVFAAEPAPVTLDEALRLAATRAPAVRAAEAQLTAADAQLNQAWANRLPSVNVSGNVLVYDAAQTFSLIQTDEPIDCTTFDAVGMGDLCASFGEETVVRDQVTSSLTVRAALPLTGQIAIDRGVAAARSARDATRSSGESTVLDARWQAEDAWYGALQVERQLEIAQAQLASLDERVKTATAAHEAGVVTRNDLLLTQLAQGQARQRVLQLGAARDAAYGFLGLAIGNGGEPVRPSGASDAPPRPAPDADALAERAIATHPGLQALRSSIDAARATAQASSWGRLPSIAALAAWQHSEGQGVFAEKDTLFAGAQLDWTVWAWGKAAAGVKAARAGESRLRAQLDQAEAGMRVDVRARARSLAAAAAAYEVATASIAQAEENLRIQEVRVQSGSGTMQELLDAEAALVSARSNQASALFEARKAEAGLTRAVGGDPWG